MRGITKLKDRKLVNGMRSLSVVNKVINSYLETRGFEGLLATPRCRHRADR